MGEGTITRYRPRRKFRKGGAGNASFGERAALREPKGEEVF